MQLGKVFGLSGWENCILDVFRFTFEVTDLRSKIATALRMSCFETMQYSIEGRATVVFSIEWCPRLNWNLIATFAWTTSLLVDCFILRRCYGKFAKVAAL